MSDVPRVAPLHQEVKNALRTVAAQTAAKPPQGGPDGMPQGQGQGQGQAGEVAPVVVTQPPQTPGQAQTQSTSVSPIAASTAPDRSWEALARQQAELTKGRQQLDAERSRQPQQADPWDEYQAQLKADPYSAFRKAGGDIQILLDQVIHDGAKGPEMAVKQTAGEVEQLKARLADMERRDQDRVQAVENQKHVDTWRAAAKDYIAKKDEPAKKLLRVASIANRMPPEQLVLVRSVAYFQAHQRALTPDEATDMILNELAPMEAQLRAEYGQPGATNPAAPAAALAPTSAPAPGMRTLSNELSSGAPTPPQRGRSLREEVQAVLPLLRMNPEQ